MAEESHAPVHGGAGEVPPELARAGVDAARLLPAERLQPMGDGSSHKLVYRIDGDKEYCFVSIPIRERAKLDAELKMYTQLESTKKVRTPRRRDGYYGAVIDGEVRLAETIRAFLDAKAMVTDLQVFILKATGEMVVFDPASVSLNVSTRYKELEDIENEIKALLKRWQEQIGAAR